MAARGRSSGLPAYSERHKNMKLYTKTGDAGETGLANGKRLSKADEVFELLGTLDELNSHLGLSLTEVEEKKIRKELLRIQDQLLIIGAVIAGSSKVTFQSSEVRWLEKHIDSYQQQFGDDWYQKFLLPGGTELAARLDVARTVCRRVERFMVRYPSGFPQRKILQKYLNRLSDYLFALRCFVNHQAGYEESEFTPKYLEMFGKK